MQFYNKSLNSLIIRIKQKPELSGIPDSLVLECLEKHLRENNINFLNARNMRKSEQKTIVKSVRAELRNLSGEFQISQKKRLGMLKNSDIISLLKTHSSTRERLESYDKIKEQIKPLNISSIMDLGCGLNPIALSSSLPNLTYYAVDINTNDLDLVRDFFVKNKIKGETFLIDIRRIEKSQLPNADLCLIFKVFDVLEKKGHKIAEKIINNVSCRYFLISFSTKTLSGKPMNHPQRGWLERLLARLGYEFKVIKTRNEIFYLANNS